MRRWWLGGQGAALVARIVATAALLVGVFLIAPVDAQMAELSALEPIRVLQRNGQYDEALASLEQLIPTLVPEASRLARILQAETYQLAGQPGVAADLWRELGRTTLDPRERSTAMFRQAGALLADGDYRQAAGKYVGFYYLRENDPMQATALARAADCYYALSEWLVAAHYYDMALETMTDPGERFVTGLRLSEARALVGSPVAGLNALVAVEMDVPTDDGLRYQYERGRMEIAAGQRAQGLARLLALIQETPRSAYAHPALVILVNEDEPVDDFLRGMVNYYAGSYVAASAAFDRYLATNPTERVAAANYYGGVSYQYAGDTEAALERYRAARARSGEEEVARAWYALAALLHLQGEGEAALAQYTALAEAQPEHEVAPLALQQAAIILTEQGNAEAARQTTADLVAKYPSSEPGWSAAMDLGMEAWKAGAVADAAEWFGAAAGGCGDCNDAARFSYWQGKALSAAGDAEGATAAWTKAGVLGGWYAVRAQQALNGGPALTAGGGGSLLLPDEAAERDEATAWVANLTGWVPGEVPAALAADTRLPMLAEYVELGLRDETAALVGALASSYREDLAVQYWLALWARDHDLYRPSILAAGNLRRYAPAEAGPLPLYMGHLAYPAYYSDLVVPEAAARGIDPLLFFALMRQESLFDATIGSVAGAQGLAQIMPATGDWIALQLGDADYETAHLHRPNVAVRFGVYYLRVQLDYLGGNVPAALSAYNAGPGNAERWLNAAGADPDLFYEAVAFAETRRYLSTVVPNYLEYLRLYGG